MEPRIIELQRKINAKPGYLVSIEDLDVGFPIKRLFYISGVDTNNSVRGQHGHYTTTQFILCLKGVAEVGAGDKKYTLDSDDRGVLIPPNNFITLNLLRDSIVLVLCDSLYKDDRVYP